MGNQLRVSKDRPRSGPISFPEVIASTQPKSFACSGRNALEEDTATAVPAKSGGAAPFPLESLLNEVLLLVLQHLTLTDLQSVGLVNRRFHDLTTVIVPKELEVNLCLLASRVRSNSFVGDRITAGVEKVLKRHGSTLRKLSIFGEHVDILQVEPVNFQPMNLLRDFVFVYCSNLTNLDLGEWMEIPEFLPSSATFAELGNALPRLTHLRMSNNLPLKYLPYFPMLRALHSRLSCYDYKEFTKPATLKRLQDMEVIGVFQTDSGFSKYLDSANLPVKCRVSAVQNVSISPSNIRTLSHNYFEPSRFFMLFPNMKSLVLELVGILNWSCIHFGNTSLTKLKFNSCYVVFSGYTPEILGVSDKLQILEIHGTNFPSYSFLKAFPNLHTFCFNSGNSSLHTKRYCHSYHSSLNRCDLDSFPLSVQIQSFEIADCGNVLNFAVEIALERGWKLRNLALKLKFSACDIVSIKKEILDVLRLKKLLLTCQNDLESINLDGNKNINNKFMKFLSKIVLKRLINLNLAGCQITQRGVEQLLIRRRARIDSGVALPLLQLFGVDHLDMSQFGIGSTAIEANVKIMPNFTSKRRDFINDYI